MAQAGGLGVIHKNISIADQAHAVRAVKKFESGMVVNPVTIGPQGRSRMLLSLCRAIVSLAFPWSSRTASA